MTISCRQALDLPELQAVRVVAGHKGLERNIHRAYLLEPGDVSGKIHDGDLVLTNGFGWPERDHELQHMVHRLHDRGVSGLVVGLGRRWPDVPDALARAADEFGLPLFTVPPEVALAEISEAVQRELFRQQYSIVERSELIHRTLTEAALEARDLQHLTNTLARILEKSVTVEDLEYRVLAHAEWDNSMDPVREATLRLGKTPDEVIDRCYSEGIIRELHTTAKPFLFKGFPDLGMRERIICPVRVSGELVAYVDILAGDKPITELDMRVAQHGGTVLALHILRQQSVAQVEARVRFTFVDALLSGDLQTDSPEFMERARLLGFDPQSSYAAVIVAPAGHEGHGRILQGREDFYKREQLAHAVRSALRLCNLPNLMTFSLNRIIFLLPAVPNTEVKLRSLGQRLYRRIQEEVPNQPVVMACGTPHQGTAGIRKSYAEANSLVAMDTSVPGLRWYEDEVVLRLLDAIPDTDILQDLHRMTLGRVLAHSKGETLYKTLRVLVQCDFRQVPTARALHVHRNTLLYRIGLLEQLLEGSFSDPGLKFRLQLAFIVEKVLRLRRA